MDKRSKLLIMKLHRLYGLNLKILKAVSQTPHKNQAPPRCLALFDSLWRNDALHANRTLSMTDNVSQNLLGSVPLETVKINLTNSQSHLISVICTDPFSVGLKHEQSAMGMLSCPKGYGYHSLRSTVYRAFDCDIILHCYKCFGFKNTSFIRGHATHQCKSKISNNFEFFRISIVKKTQSGPK